MRTFAKWFATWLVILAYVAMLMWLMSRSLSYLLGEPVAHAKLGVTALILWICAGGSTLLTLREKYTR